jgi:hypothetical protein
MRMEMATSLQATKVLEALEKAKRVGKVEEAVVIDGCSFVFQNLSPAAYDSIHEETKDLDEVQYLHAYQIGHVCRSIVEIQGEDLRDVDFIEDTIPSGSYGLVAYVSSKKVGEKLAEDIKKAGGKATVIPPDGEARTIKLERHEWIKDNLLSSWGREAITVAWRKFADVLIMADEKAKKGIQFKVPDESAEDRLRRLVGELKEVEDDLPAELVRAILDDAGYQSKSTTAELQAANEKLQRVAEAQKPAEPPQPPVGDAGTPKPEKAVEGPPEAPREAPEVDPMALMQRRKPLNQQATQVPIPKAGPTSPAVRPSRVPDQIRRAAEANAASLQPDSPPINSRAAQIAALEAQAGLPVADEPALPKPPVGEVAELSRKERGIDGESLRAIVDRPPVAGINPRFRPPGT